jgi:hypothetical protein
VRKHGIRGRLGPALRAYLEAHLPRSASDANDGSTFLAVTQGASQAGRVGHAFLICTCFVCNPNSHQPHKHPLPLPPKVWPTVKTMLHYSFPTTADLIDAMLASWCALCYFVLVYCINVCDAWS